MPETCGRDVIGRMGMRVALRGSRLGLLVLAHDRSENGALEFVEGGEMQAADPEARERAAR